MAGDEGTLATTAQVIFLLGENAGANQILEANTNYAILFAESLLYLETGSDFVTNIGTVDANLKQSLALYAGATAAIILINQNPNSWALSVTQDKKNVLNTYANQALKRIKEADIEW